jgi:peptide/nickel transport system substrate-binding protein
VFSPVSRAKSLLAFAAVTVLVAGCGTSTATPTAAPTTAATIAATAAPTAAPTTAMADALTMYTPGGQAPDFNPANGSVNEYNFLAPVYDPLIRRGSDGSFNPSLATEWSYSTDGLTFNMTLQSGVKFSDGTVFDAAAVKANIENVKNGTGSYAAQFKSISDVTVVDATHVKLTLSAANPSLPVLFSTAAGMIAAPSALGSKTLSTTPVGTGAYTYDAAASVANDTLVFNIKADYWNPGHYHFKKVTLKIFSDETAAVDAVASGAADISEFSSALPKAAAAGIHLVGATYNVWGLGLLDRAGTLVPALKSPAVRQALNYAFDRTSIVKTVMQGFGAPTTQVLKSWMEGYDKDLDSAFPYDVAKAKQMLADAGYPNGFTFEAVSLSFFDFEVQAWVGFLKAIGVTMVVKNVAPDQYISSIVGGKFPAAVLPYGALDSYFDIGQLFLPDSAFNPFKSSDDQINAWYKQAATASASDRAGLLKQINDRVTKDLAWWIAVNGDEFGYGYNTKKVTPAPWTGLRPLLLFDWMPGA